MTKAIKLRTSKLVLAILGIAVGSVWAEPTPLEKVTDVTQAAFSPDASRVLVCTSVGELSLWDAATGAPVPGALNLPGESFVISPDSKLVLVSMGVAGARIFDLQTGEARSPQFEVHFRDPRYPEAAFTPNNSSVVVFEPEVASVISTETGERLAKIPIGGGAQPEDVETGPSATFTKDGSQCFLMSAAGVATCYDTKTWKPLGKPMKHPAGQNAYHFGSVSSDDGKWLATFDDPGENGPKGNLQIWDVASGKAVGKPISAVNGLSAAFLPGTSRVLAKPGRGESRVFDLPTMKKTIAIPAHDEVDGPQTAISPDGKWILSWGPDHFLQLQSTATGKVQESQVFQCRISQVLILPDSSGCLVVFDNSAFLTRDYYDHYVLKLSLPSLETTHSLRITEFLQNAVLAPNGSRVLLQAGKQQGVLIYDTATLTPSSGDR